MTVCYNKGLQDGGKLLLVSVSLLWEEKNAKAAKRYKALQFSSLLQMV